ncbi:hypothetical protein HZC21_02200 [Candidatus Peregrinibacteria bacterium]|nr:hypothetical protein [Candidatus Peregrinibacteria bacterium]
MSNEQPPDGSEPVEKSTQEILENWIGFPQVKIVAEDDDTYTVTYDGQEYTFNKEEMKEEIGAYAGGSGAVTMEIRLELRQVFQPEHGFFLNLDIPPEFIKAIIFHEIGHEKYEEYADAHQRALHDEILYVMKHFPPELRERYFRFAEEVRERAVREKLEEELPQRPLDPEEIKDLLRELDIEYRGDIKIDDYYGDGGAVHCDEIIYDGFSFSVTFYPNQNPSPRIHVFFTVEEEEDDTALLENGTEVYLVEHFIVPLLEKQGIDNCGGGSDGAKNHPFENFSFRIPLDNRNGSRLKNSIKEMADKLKTATPALKEHQQLAEKYRQLRPSLEKQYYDNIDS